MCLFRRITYLLTAIFLLFLLLLYRQISSAADWEGYTISTRHHAAEPVTTVTVSPINLNTADEEQLQELSGIGPALAANIIAYRTEHGPFQSWEDVLNVSGIGEAKLAGIKERGTLGITEREDTNENIGSR